MSKIVLCMIVKNESEVIERCLASTLPIIDTFCIVDTGSTDDTISKIRKFFEQVGIDGVIHERPWVNFGTNRTEALELARPLGDYTWMIDADEILEFDGNFDPDKFKASLKADLYNVFASYGGIKYHRPQLTSNKKQFVYRGILHEYVDCTGTIDTRDFANGILNRPIQDGARSKLPDKYAKDAEVFEEALKGKVDEKDFNRYHFYLAQSYRDSQQWQKAHDAYIKRAKLGGWNEEVFYSLFQVGRLKEILEHPIDEIVRYYVQAYDANPWRAEPLWAAARACKVYGRFDQAFVFAKQASRLPHPNGALFVSTPVYEWLALDELCVSSLWLGKFRTAINCATRLLNENKYPPEHKQRIESNYRFAEEGLRNPPPD